MKSINHLEVTYCGRAHEKNWQGKPLNQNTVRHIKKCVRDCILAKLGLNANCAHKNLHKHNADEIFEAGLSSYSSEQKDSILAKWELFSKLNSRVDQLHRFGNGGDLDKIIPDYDLLEERKSESEDHSLHEVVLSIAKSDPLRILLLCIGSMSEKKEYIAEYWDLLENAERILVSRKGTLLNGVRNKYRVDVLLGTTLHI